MTRRAGRAGLDWTTPEKDYTWQHVEIEILMDIREELKSLNELLHCRNFTSVPHKLERIANNTSKRKRARRTP